MVALTRSIQDRRLVVRAGANDAIYNPEAAKPSPVCGAGFLA